MTISSLSGSVKPILPLPANYGASASITADASAAASTDGSSDIGTFASAIFQAFSQRGISGTSSSAGTSSTGSLAIDRLSASVSSSNPLQALGSFMQTLIATLQNQSGPSVRTAVAPPTTSAPGGAPAASDTPAATATSSSYPVASLARPHHGRYGGHGGGVSQIELNLQSLIQELSSGSSTSSTTPPSGTNVSGAITSGVAIDSVQQSFQALTDSLGSASSTASTSLGNFLQTFSQSLENFGSAGNIVNTQA